MTRKDSKWTERGLAVSGGEHIFSLRVYYEDTDAAGIVYYANYLRFAERARTEMLRELGIESSAMMDADGVAFAVRRCEADYLRPARLDDRLEVRSRLLALKGASLALEQRIVRTVDGAEIARLVLTLACLTVSGAADESRTRTKAGQAARIPAEIRRRLQAAHLQVFNDPER